MRAFAKTVLPVLALALLAVVAGILALESAWGQRHLAAWAEARMIRAFAGRATVRGLGGHFPGRITIARVELEDDDGPWLVATDVAVDVRLRDLARRPALIQSLSVEHVGWLRTPRARDTGGKAPRGTVRLPAFNVAGISVRNGHIDAGVLGEPFDLRLTGGLSSDRRRVSVVVDAASLDGAEHLSATGNIHTATGDLEVRAHGEDAEGILCHRLAALNVTGLVADVTAKGWGPSWTGDVALVASDGRSVSGRVVTAEGPSVSIDAELGGIVVSAGHLSLEPTRARMNVARGEDHAEGALSIEGQSGGRAVSASADLALIGKGYVFTNLQVVADGARAYGGMYVVNGRPAGRLHVTVTEPDALSWLTGMGMTARGTADVRIRSEQIRADVEMKDFVAAAWTVGDTTGRVTLAREDGHWAMTAVAAARDVRRQAIQGSNVLVHASGDRAGLAVRLRADGSISDQPFVADMAAQVHALPAGTALQVTAFQTSVAGIPVVLAAPFSLEVSAQSISWTGVDIAVASGRITSAGRVQEDGIDVQLDVDHIPLATMASRAVPGMEGELSGHLDLAGTPSAPTARADIEMAHARPLATPGFVFAPADVSLQAGYSNGVLAAALELAGWSDEPVRAHVEWPVAVTFLPWRVEVQREEPMKGSLHAGFDLSRLRSLADLRGSIVQGVVTCELTLAGTPGSPDVRGRVSLRDGRFEFLDSGTVLKNVQMTLVGDRERLVVRDASASDGGQGRLGLEGHVLFRPVDSFPVEAALVFERAELWRQGGSRVALDGRLTLTGNLHEVLLAGSLKVPDAEIELARPRPRVVTLDVKGLESIVARQPRQPSPWLAHVKLDLKLSGKGIKVSGRGLESTWGGNVHVTGRAAAPQLAGQVAVERGYFLFMGRRFALDRGYVSVDGRYPPAPELNVTASGRAADMVAWLNVTGPVSEPTLVLNSDPPYPTDEILSHLLFGKSVDSVTALQAVRLAYGLEVLRGHGTTLDVLDRGQSILRVDQIELKQDDTSGELSSVSVGKYIGRNVYVQGEKALGQSEDVISVEVEMTPSLVLQTETSPRIREGVGVKWRRDY